MKIRDSAGQWRSRHRRVVYHRRFLRAKVMATSTSPTRPVPAPSLRPVAEVWAVAWPTVLTMTSYTIMQFVDSLMVGQVGPLQVAAQGNGGIWAFVPLAMIFGFLNCWFTSTK